MASKGKRQFSNGKDKPGTGMHHMSWFIISTHKFHHQLQEQGEPTFTTFIQDQGSVHH